MNCPPTSWSSRDWMMVSSDRLTRCVSSFFEIWLTFFRIQVGLWSHMFRPEMDILSTGFGWWIWQNKRGHKLECVRRRWRSAFDWLIWLTESKSDSWIWMWKKRWLAFDVLFVNHWTVLSPFFGRQMRMLLKFGLGSHFVWSGLRAVDYFWTEDFSFDIARTKF